MPFRLDRFATLYVGNALQRLRSDSKLRVPVLMYHSISDCDETRLHPYYRTVTSPAQFERQMAFLKYNGYTAISPGKAVSYLTTNSPEPLSKTVIITFDDGFLDFYEKAFPVLSRYGFAATVYLPTAYISQEHPSFKEKPCMTWGEIRDLSRHGILFGSHTATHPQLHDLCRQQIREELCASKQSIEQNLGSAVDSFAYPYAFPETDVRFKQVLRTELLAAGYTNGVCTTLGTADPGSDPLFLKRLPVNSADDLRLFAAKLAGSYDWVARPQYCVKLAKRWVHGRSARSAQVIED